MLVVKNRIDKSGINGFGVFAAEPITAGSLVWQFVPGIDLELSRQQITSLPAAVQDHILHHANQTGQQVFLLCGDNARFMNHSDRPNVSAAGECNYALCDIAAGEEIVCDYREFDIGFTGF